MKKLLSGMALTLSGIGVDLLVILGAFLYGVIYSISTYNGKCSIPMDGGMSQ